MEQPNEHSYDLFLSCNDLLVHLHSILFDSLRSCYKLLLDLIGVQTLHAATMTGLQLDLRLRILPSQLRKSLNTIFLFWRLLSLRLAQLSWQILQPQIHLET